jgi:guanylate kinase
MAFSPKYGVLLSGLTGVGKSTLQDALLRAGCWTPKLVTTRNTEDTERSIVEHLPHSELLLQLQAGELVAPVFFGGSLYAWPRSDFDRLRTNPSGAVVSARPYTALLLSATNPKLIPIWLDLGEDERLQRLTKRDNARDKDASVVAQRLSKDTEDLLYRELFPVRIRSDGSAFLRVSGIMEGITEPHR